ncbi:hypothetical protein D8M34_13070 [Microbacterium sp. HSID17254]|nr:hypothetical protein AXH82_07290 [Microbacterium sp. PAMC 28756]OSP08654.1 hypothetical protein B7W94_03130 [Microbacterium sp. LEMMJ01]RUQ04700.1 hypothetical protein D8M34_13070 [Microbacterium sp. HSID17254]
MIRPLRARPYRPASRERLITRIITAVGLAVLLTAGAWLGGSHLDAPDSSEHVSVMLAALAADAPASEQVGDPPSGDGFAAQFTDAATVGGVGCLIGVLCCVILFIVGRAFRVARATSRETTVLLRPVRPLPADARADVPSLSLTQLSLSRT